jgi:ABC-type microcin C transport system permease subunit YejB
VPAYFFDSSALLHDLTVVIDKQEVTARPWGNKGGPFAVYLQKKQGKWVSILPERLVLSRHLVRNACLPMITLIGLSIPALLAGNLILETVFNYPGLGLLFYNSLGNADYQVLLALTLVGATLVVVGNFVADIALTVADPRIRL